ncbi:hypothetical protein LCGC14_0411980 [marine sediment metagenome]|uniref:Uncharacterized protein n=1 Tax=marine sediment metagenome TaxID=412755 RepID=A0A0F9VFN1_9ZZZZ
MRITNRAKIGKTMLQDVKGVVGSIHKMNAPGAIGYGFDPHRLGKKIARGMFIDYRSEISDWTYYLDFKTGVLRKIGGQATGKRTTRRKR